MLSITVVANRRRCKKSIKPLFRGANVNAISGTGLGMPIAKKAANMLRGNTTNEQTSPGAKVTVVLSNIL